MLKKSSPKKSVKIKTINTIKTNPLSTPTAKSIIKDFKKWMAQHSNIEVDYSRWYCGITNNPPKRKNAHKHTNRKDTFAWVDKNAKSRRIADAVETYFHKLGLKDSDSKGGSKIDSKYVYIYKKRPTWFD